MSRKYIELLRKEIDDLEREIKAAEEKRDWLIIEYRFQVLAALTEGRHEEQLD